MISSTDIKRSYINLYKNLRNYFWDYYTVCDIVNLEKAVLTRFPDSDMLRYYASRLDSATRNVQLEDDDLKSAFDKFKAMLNEDECGYAYLPVNIQES